MVGEWTQFKPCSGKECEMFEQMLEGYTGEKFTPLSVATQVVQGTNYCFYCNGQMVTSPEYKNPEMPFKVYAFQPLGEERFDKSQMKVEKLPLKP